MPRQRTTLPTIVQAPMAGGPSTVALAVAVSNAGGLGFLAGGYVSGDDLATSIAELRAATTAAFGVNLFVIRERPVDEAALAAYVASLEPDAAALGTELGEATFDDDALDAKLQVVLDARVPVVSFAFGCPDEAVVAALQDVGTRVWVTVATPDEAAVAIAAGCDALVAQGTEAGGHRSSFDDAEPTADALAVLDLVAALAAGTDVPIVAAGGIATADDVRAALAAGAAAVQCGTAFLLADEAGTNPAHRTAVASARATDFTRAYTGRTARGIVTDFMRAHPDAPRAYPQVHHATSPLRTAARLAGDAERMSLWAGTRHELAEPRPASEIVAVLAEGARERK